MPFGHVKYRPKADVKYSAAAECDIWFLGHWRKDYVAELLCQALMVF